MFRDRSRVVKFLIQLENKIYQCGNSIQAHCIRNTGILVEFPTCTLYVTFFFLHRGFTVIRKKLNAMKNNIELCLLKGQRKTFMNSLQLKGDPLH